VIHLDTAYVVDLLREAGRGEEGPATAAVVDQARVVTRDARHLERVPGLHVLSY